MQCVSCTGFSSTHCLRQQANGSLLLLVLLLVLVHHEPLQLGLLVCHELFLRMRRQLLLLLQLLRVLLLQLLQLLLLLLGC